MIGGVWQTLKTSYKICKGVKTAIEVCNLYGTLPSTVEVCNILRGTQTSLEFVKSTDLQETFGNLCRGPRPQPLLRSEDLTRGLLSTYA